jgi:hypothetical protein
MRHPEAAVRSEALMPFSLPAIVGAGPSSRQRRCVRREARRGSASPKRRRRSRTSLPSLPNLALHPAAARVSSSGLGSRGRKGGRG